MQGSVLINRIMGVYPAQANVPGRMQIQLSPWQHCFVLSAATAVWELRVQLCTDLEEMPAEDASVEWAEHLSPSLPIARHVSPLFFGCMNLYGMSRASDTSKPFLRVRPCLSTASGAAITPQRCCLSTPSRHLELDLASSLYPHRQASIVMARVRARATRSSGPCPDSAISGSVHDPNQLVVPGAQVRLDGADVHLTATSDGAGHYTFASPGPDSYTVTAQKPGFNPVGASFVLPAGASLAEDLNFTTLNASASVTVQAAAAGTSSAGYYVGTVDRGVLGSAPIADQPYTITLLPADQIANTQVKNLRDALKYLPLVQFTEQQGPEIIRPATRGIQGSIAQNTRMDGMAMAITGANPMEQYQELQVENGLGGPLYGPANPSGMFDFVLKRATEERTNNLYLEQDSSSVGTAWLDSAVAAVRTSCSATGPTCSIAMALTLLRTAVCGAGSPCSPAMHDSRTAPRSMRTTASTTSCSVAIPGGLPMAQARPRHGAGSCTGLHPAQRSQPHGARVWAGVRRG